MSAAAGVLRAVERGLQTLQLRLGQQRLSWLASPLGLDSSKSECSQPARHVQSRAIRGEFEALLLLACKTDPNLTLLACSFRLPPFHGLHKCHIRTTHVKTIVTHPGASLGPTGGMRRGLGLAGGPLTSWPTLRPECQALRARSSQPGGAVSHGRPRQLRPWARRSG